MGSRSVRRWFALLSCAAGASFACNVDHATRSGPRLATKAVSPAWVGPAHSGSWYTASRSGEGFTLQILENGSALAVWFTYPPAGSPARQAWIMAQDGRLEGDRIRFQTVFTTRGPRFGASFDPAQVQVLPWGTLEMRFTDCNNGEVTFAGPAGWGSGTRAITRLSALSELECSGKRRLSASGTRTAAGLAQRSGALYDPAHNGEGWQLEELPDGRAQVYWFTYDENGEQAWTIGTAPSTGARLDVTQNFQPVGTRFGAGFDPAAVTATPWGTYTMEFSACDRAEVRYASTLPAYGAGTLRPIRLTRLAGAACLDAFPAVPANGTWSQGATMPVAHSETGIAVVGARACVAGGFPAAAEVQCYDAQANAWSRIASLPGGRDHSIAIAAGSDMFVAGGNGDVTGSQARGWRYRAAENRWEDVPELPAFSASGAAMLGGFAYFGSAGGDLMQFDPRTLASRRIPGDNRSARDHSQVVAFQGEIWMLGGRSPLVVDHNRVSIYDPASETWRAGPAMRASRAGFAAAASATAVFVAGGERLQVPQRTLDNVEAIGAGQDAWTELPRLPFAVHGVPGFIHGNAFITLGGSRAPGVAANEGQVQIYRWTP